MYSAGGSVPRNEFKLIRGTDFILGTVTFSVQNTKVQRVRRVRSTQSTFVKGYKFSTGYGDNFQHGARGVRSTYSTVL